MTFGLCLHGLGGLFQFGNKLPVFSGLFPLSIDHRLGGIGHKLLVGELLLRDAQTVLGLFFLLGDTLQLRLEVRG